MLTNSIRIGIFDSGIGGLTLLPHLLKAILESRLARSLVIEYVADSEFAPYGDKSSREVLDRSYRICQYLSAKQISILVVACNTATALAIDNLRREFNMKIIGVEPGVKPAMKISASKAITILATEATINSDRFNALLWRLDKNREYTFTTISGSGLVESIEALDFSCETPLGQKLSTGFQDNQDVLVLGCTHYAFLIPSILRYQTEYSLSFAVVDTAVAISNHIVNQFLEDTANHQPPNKQPPNKQPQKHRPLEYQLHVTATNPKTKICDAAKQLGLVITSMHSGESIK